MELVHTATLVHDDFIDEAVTRAGLDIGRTDLVVHHYGHLPDYGKVVDRNRLYARLLRDKVSERPEDPRARYELAVQLANEGRLRRPSRPFRLNLRCRLSSRYNRRPSARS